MTTFLAELLLAMLKDSPGTARELSVAVDRELTAVREGLDELQKDGRVRIERSAGEAVYHRV